MANKNNTHPADEVEDNLEKFNENSDSGWREPSKEKIAKWKKEHDTDSITVFVATDDRDKQKKKAYFRSPNIVDLQRAASSEKAKPGTFNQSIFENCLLDCHPDVKLYQPLLLGMLTQVGELSTAAEVTIVKL